MYLVKKQHIYDQFINFLKFVLSSEAKTWLLRDKCEATNTRRWMLLTSFSKNMFENQISKFLFSFEFTLEQIITRLVL